MKILFVAMSDSIHTARWIKQIVAHGWDVRLFPVHNHGIVHPELNCIFVYHTLMAQCGGLNRKLRLQRYRLFRVGRDFFGMELLSRFWPQGRKQQLKRIINEFKPDIIHSLEFQAAGYLVAKVKKEIGRNFPAWIATNWGSDIYYFRNFPEHEVRIREVLEQCDYYSCECQRDVCLAEGLGLKGLSLPVLPNAGGFDMELLDRFRQEGPVSSRRNIMLKGYQHWVGRALVALEALGKCADLLDGYELTIHSASPETREAARVFRRKTGVKVTVLPHKTPHEKIMKIYGASRLAIGLSLSDGISTSFLEAMVMGALPIQSWTACVDEWCEDGVSCLLVPPEDTTAVVRAIRRGLTDNELVDSSAVRNAQIARIRLDYEKNRAIAADYYRIVARKQGLPCS